MNKGLKYVSVAALGAGLFISGAVAADMVVHDQNAKAPYANSVKVPAGYDTYYVSGSTGEGGDTAAQTAATLAGLKAQLAKLGLTFGDVVQAHVFLVADPAKANGRLGWKPELTDLDQMIGDAWRWMVRNAKPAD